MAVETAWLIDELLFRKDVDDDRNDEVRARGPAQWMSEGVDEHDGTEANQKTIIKEIGSRLQDIADKLKPDVTIGAAEEFAKIVTSSSPNEVDQKFEKVALEAIRLADPGTSTNLAAVATIYCIGKQALARVGYDNPLSQMVGDCMKKFLTSRIGSVVLWNEKTGEWVRCRLIRIYRQ